jgi:hypothetical protein
MAMCTFAILHRRHGKLALINLNLSRKKNVDLVVEVDNLSSGVIIKIEDQEK